MNTERQRQQQREWRSRNPEYMRNYCRAWADAQDSGRVERREQKAQDNRFTPEHDALLGTDRDVVIAELIGKTPNAIWKRRQRLGVKAFRGRKPRVNRNGYVVVYLAPVDPLAGMARAGGYVMEHRLVMARHIGRQLRKAESVHHKNAVKTDNRIENLELWSSTQPSGQRVTDLVEWAQHLLSLYEPQMSLFRS